MRSSTKNAQQSSARSFLAALTLAVATVACSSNDPAPSPAPTLSSTTPLDAAANVGLDATPTATFDLAMSALDSTSFTLVQGTTAVAGTVSTNGTTATFTPLSALAPDSTYTATVTSGAKSTAGMALAANQSWSFHTLAPAGTTAPHVVSTAPADSATGIALNSRISAVFDLPMTALTGSNFTLSQGVSPVAGTVSNSADGTAAVFAPAANLTANTVYSANLTAATSAAGAALAADHAWTFTTGAAADTTAPTVTAKSPADTATGVAINTKVVATFSKPMDPHTITAASFTVKQGTTAVPGSVSYGAGQTATFAATSPLSSSIVYTASLSTAVSDLSGNPLAAAVTWSFTTGTNAAKGPAPVLLGAAGNYVVLAKTAVSTVPTSAVTGAIGLSPAAASFLTGFSLTADSTNVFATSPQITGKAYAANYAVPTPSNLTTAVSNMEAAYTDAASRPTPDFLELGTGNIGGKTLAPGLYKWTSAVTMPANVTISGGANDVWIFQTSGDLSMAASKQITLAGGALAKNIFWQVAGHTTFGAGAHFEGVLLCKTDVTLQTGATMNGRILAQTAVALQQATVTQPAP